MPRVLMGEVPGLRKESTTWLMKSYASYPVAMNSGRSALSHGLGKEPTKFGSVQRVTADSWNAPLPLSMPAKNWTNS